jgi:S1-C subfamily serine protease
MQHPGISRLFLWLSVVALIVAGATATTWAGAGLFYPVPAIAQTETQAEGILPTQEVLTRLYNEAGPSVVNIQITAAAGRGMQQQPQVPPFGPPDEMPPAQGLGSGFMYDDEGHIVTNNHVVENATSITVYFVNGMWAEAELVAADPQADLAVIRVDPPDGVDWQPLPLAEAGTLQVGHYVAALGSPFGLENTMTTGIVSALGRAVPVGRVIGGPTYSLPDVVQTDAAINPGNSGGPLINLEGEVVGVNFAINSPIRANAGVGFAIPVSVVERVVPALIEEGGYTYAYLGIAGSTINAIVAEEEDLPANTLGLFVGDVVSGGPAATGGVEAGDVVVAIDDEPVRRFEDLISYLFSATEPGQEITLTILRNGDEEEVTVVVGARPTAEAPQIETQPEPQEARISISEALRIAREAVMESELLAQIDGATAVLGVLDERSVWLVTLTGEGRTAAVAVDAQTGEVVSLELQ